MERCRVFLGWLFEPVRRMAGFFAGMALLLAVVPFAQMAVTHGRLLTLAVYAVVQGVALAYLLASGLCCVRSAVVRRVVMWLLMGLAALRAVVEVGSIAMTECPVTAESALLMVETDASEAAGFFRAYLSWRAVMAIVLTGCVVAAVAAGFRRLTRGVSAWPWGRAVAGAVIGVVSLWGGARIAMLARVGWFNDFGQLREWVERNDGNQMLCVENQLLYGDPLTKGLYVANLMRLQNMNLDDWEEVQRRALGSEVTPVAPERDFSVAVIVGESFVRCHTPLYGYRLPVTPRLCDEASAGRLAVFTDMMTTANFTTAALRNCFNLNSIARGEEWSEGVYFPLVVKKGGWDVYHYDNQTVSYDTDMGIGRMFYAPVVMEGVYDGVSDKVFGYDGEYVGYVDRILRPRERDGRKMVIYHLAGQHFPFEGRYPSAGPFAAKDITVNRPWLDEKGRQSVAHYDNATHYNDSVVGAIIDSWKDVPAVMFYFSDHGEDLADLAEVKARNRQMPEDPAWIDRQYHIPFIVWMSDGFIARFPDEARRLREAVGRPGSLDDLGHMIIGLTGIGTEYYRPDRDILSPAYNPVPRVSEMGYPLEIAAGSPE